MNDAARSAIGDVLAGGYRLLDVLAVGGSGTVYRAERLSDGRPVAIKRMHAEHPEGDAERQRFSREASVLQELEHPHVVRVLDYGHTADGIPFLVFPLLAGRTLGARLRAEGPLSWEETGRLATQMLSALERAHAHDIVHRDIKPANVFLCPSVLGDNVQLLDFGLARAVRGAVDVEVTRAGAVVGTPRYMAPEQVRGERVGPTADIYSLGLVLAEMVTGSPLCSAERELDIYMVHGSDKPLALPAEVLRSPFAAIVRRAVAKPLEVRYRLASQMLADVRAVVDTLGVAIAVLPSADMEATYLVDGRGARNLSIPSDTSEKLRDAFNAMARKADANEPPPTLRRAVPSAAETLPVSIPEAAGSVPILLTRAPGEDADTLRMRRPDAFAIPEAPRTIPYVEETVDDPEPRRLDGAAVAEPRRLDGAPVIEPRRLDGAAVAEPRRLDGAPVIEPRRLDGAAVIEPPVGAPSLGQPPPPSRTRLWIAAVALVVVFVAAIALTMVLARLMP